MSIAVATQTTASVQRWVVRTMGESFGVGERVGASRT
jgi:hypothetical protein